MARTGVAGDAKALVRFRRSGVLFCFDPCGAEACEHADQLLLLLARSGHAGLHGQGASDHVKIAEVSRSLAAAFVVQHSLQFTNNDQGVIERVDALFNLAGCDGRDRTVEVAEDGVVESNYLAQRRSAERRRLVISKGRIV